jgi:small subunit ribosomal protein S9
VRLFPGGTGNLVINDKDGSDYLPRAGDIDIVMQPLVAIGQEKGYDISVHVQGGGITGQRDAIRLGIARALVKLDPDLRSSLKHNKYLTRDPRVKERKKPGLVRARKAPTYTKR